MYEQSKEEVEVSSDEDSLGPCMFITASGIPLLSMGLVLRLLCVDAS